jgi:hypothetical protein
MSTQGWLGDILGLNIRDDTGGDDVALTRRGTLRISGLATLTPRPDEELIELEIGTGALATADHAALSVIGRSAATDGAAADIVATVDNRVFARSTTVGWFQVATDMLADLAVTAAKIANLTITGAKIAAATITADKLSGVLEMAYTATVTSSRNLAAGDVFSCINVNSTSGAVVITLTKTATFDPGVGKSGIIRWVSGSNDVSVAAEDGTVTVNSSGDEYKVDRVKDHIYWELTAANTYSVSGAKRA